MVEELKFLIEAQKDYDRRETQSHWKTLSNSSHSFLRDHGQALVEALEQNERSMDALRASVIALVHASESNSTYTPTYELVVGALYGTKASAGGGA